MSNEEVSTESRTLRSFIETLRTPEGRTRHLQRPLFAGGLVLLIVSFVAPITLMFQQPLTTVLTVILFPAFFFASFLYSEFVAFKNFGKRSTFGAAFFQANMLPFRPKLSSLQRSLNDTRGVPDAEARGVMVNGIIQSPAIIQLRGDELLLTPAVGKPVTLTKSQIAFVKESAWFNGSYTPGQTGFTFKVPFTWRMGFAISGDPQPWRAFFAHTASTEQSSD